MLAFEPQPRLARLLEQSFAANGFDHAAVYELACGDRDGVATLHVPHTASGVGGLYEAFSAAYGGAGCNGLCRYNVAVRRLDGVLAGQPLPGRVALKLDAEGSELPALRGAAELLRARRPLILVELNPASARAAGYTMGDLFDFLVAAGYDRAAEADEFPRRTRPLAEANTGRQRNLFVVPPRSCRPGGWDL